MNALAAHREIPNKFSVHREDVSSRDDIEDFWNGTPLLLLELAMLPLALQTQH